jgi:uncharacterized membrane protein YgcG
MELQFPELRGGPLQGLNDAGVENFQGAIEWYLARECGQNTGDAPGKGVKTVRLEFDRKVVRAADIPALAQLRDTLKRCLDKWCDKAKEREFFQQAVALAAKDEITLLKISDYGTTGLTGRDTEDLERWSALVKSTGVSDKGDTAGGSFGIGKSSPFAASRFRTVFYGTRTEAGDVALQGVSRLVTHLDKTGKRTQGVGFIGDYDPSGGEGGDPLFRAIRDQGRIPQLFRRTDPGTDIWVVGYRSGNEWSANLIRAILTNFWPAIHHGSIQFRVGIQTITKDNLEHLLKQHIGQEDFEAHQFYKAIKHQPISKKLKYVGDCGLYLAADSSQDLPKQICMVRKAGMRIFDYAPKACRVPFSGLFICSDIEGNKLLRKMEPPKHDGWDPKRIEGEEGKKALDEIKLWIREEVKKLNPFFAGSSFNESELAKYVPDDAQADLPSDGAGRSSEESLEPKPAKAELQVKATTPKPVTLVPEGTGSGATPEHEGDGGGGGGSGGGQSEGGSGGKDEGSKRGAVAKPPRISVRSYRSGPNEYHLVLRSPVRFGGGVRLFAVGEGGYQEPVAVNSAHLDTSGGNRLLLKNGAIHGLQLKPDKPLRIIVKLNEFERRSLTAAGES